MLEPQGKANSWRSNDWLCFDNLPKLPEPYIYSKSINQCPLIQLSTQPKVFAM